MKTVRTSLFLLAAAIAPAFAAAPTWDNSGNSQLSGQYYFREVLYLADASGNTSRWIALYGNITFNGATPGTYTLSNASVQDSGGGFNISATGTYSVSASGFGFMSNPLVSGGNVSFLVSNHIIVASDTESGYNQMFVAAPVPSSLTLSSVTSSYTIDGFFQGGSPAGSADLTWQFNPASSNVAITGYAGSGTTLTQNSSGVKYVASGNAVVTTFPNSNTATFYVGPEYMYFSPDLNFVFGGSPSGYDMFIGVRNTAGGTSTPLSGLYYEAGLDENTAQALDSYYGVLNAYPGGNTGNVIGHERLLYSGTNAQSITYYTSFPTTISGSYKDPSNSTLYTIGQGGIRISTGLGQYLALSVALPYTPPTPTGAVYIDPTGIVNTASSAPYTAGIAPGEFVTIYNGSNLAASTIVESGAPYPTQLGGVQVLVNGFPAPLYYVSANSVSFIVPYAVIQYPYASIQINNNGTVSNVVTTIVRRSSPGVFTSNPVGGVGVAALLDFPSSGGYYIVSANKPANAGDTVALFLTGLGAPYQPNGDGALGPATGDPAVNTVYVDVGGVDVGTLPYAGLAPGLAGLYQVNFTVPAATTPGTYKLGIQVQILATNGTTLLNDSYSNESVIPVGSGVKPVADSTATAVPGARSSLPRISGTAAR